MPAKYQRQDRCGDPVREYGVGDKETAHGISPGENYH